MAIATASKASLPRERADLLEVLKSNHWFGQLPDDALEIFAGGAVVQQLRRGDLFTKKDQLPPGLGILINGTVCCSSVSMSGQEFALSMMEFDGIIGLAAMLDGKESLRDSRAYSDAAILLIPRQHFLSTLERFPLLYRHFTNILCGRIRAANRIIDDLALRSLRQRLASLLWAQSHSPGKFLLAQIPCHVMQTQDDLANLLGVSRHAVNRELKRMEKSGALRVGYGSISILDPYPLKHIAECE